MYLYVFDMCEYIYLYVYIFIRMYIHIYIHVHTGTVGMSEELAIEEYGDEQVSCYASVFQPLEWALKVCKCPHVYVYMLIYIIRYT
jgi:hypothetical protein